MKLKTGLENVFKSAKKYNFDKLITYSKYELESLELRCAMEKYA